MSTSGALMAMMFLAVAPVLPGMAAHFGRTGDGALTAQLFMTMPSIGVIVGGPTTGWLVERLGCRTMLLASLILYGVAGATGLIIDNAWVLVVSRLFLGYAVAGVATSSTTLTSLRYEGDKRTRVIGYQSAAAAVFGLLILLVAGVIGEIGGWHAPFALYLISFIILAFALVAIPPTGRTIATQKTENAGSLKPLWTIYAVMTLVYVAIFTTAVQLSFLLADNGVNSPMVQSWVFAVSSIMTAAGAAAYGSIGPRLGSRRSFALCLALIGTGLFVIGLSHGPQLAAAGVAVAALGGGAVGPYLLNVLLDRAPEAVRGRAIGFMYTALFTGDFLNPLILTPLRVNFGIHTTFLILGIAVALSTSLIALHARLVPPRPMH